MYLFYWWCILMIWLGKILDGGGVFKYGILPRFVQYISITMTVTAMLVNISFLWCFCLFVSAPDGFHLSPGVWYNRGGCCWCNPVHGDERSVHSYQRLSSHLQGTKLECNKDNHCGMYIVKTVILINKRGVYRVCQKKCNMKRRFFKIWK